MYILFDIVYFSTQFVFLVLHMHAGVTVETVKLVVKGHLTN